MKRKEFIKTSALGVGAMLLLSNCEEEEPEVEGKSIALTTITNNHGHQAFSLTAGDIDNLLAGNYILNTAAHSHQLTLTSNDLQSLKDGTSITRTTIDGGHTHDVTIQYS